METGDSIALGALVVAVVAVVVSSVIAALAAMFAARSAKAAETAAEHAGESVGVARDQLVLNREMRDDQDAPTFKVELSPRDRPGEWLIRAKMTAGPAVLDVELSYSGRATYQRPHGVTRTTPLRRPLGESVRETVSAGGSAYYLVHTEEHIERLWVRVVLVCTELLDIEEPATPRTWPVVCERLVTRPASGSADPPP